jgi:type IV pilus assembly protein PilF
MKQLRAFLMMLMSVLLVTLVSGCATSGSPTSDAVRARARAHTDLGAAYFQQKKLNIALEEFSLAAKIDPEFGFAYNGLGLVNAALGQDESADAAFKKAIALDSKNSEAHKNYGNFLCSRGKYKASIDEYLIAVENPVYTTPAAAYTNAGICSVRANDTKSAEIYFAKALQVKPLSKVAAYQLASLQFKRNDAQRAFITLSNALVNNPSAEALYLAVQITNALALQREENEYRVQLFRKYPNSKQAAALKSGMVGH